MHHGEKHLKIILLKCKRRSYADRQSEVDSEIFFKLGEEGGRFPSQGEKRVHTCPSHLFFFFLNSSNPLRAIAHFS